MKKIIVPIHSNPTGNREFLENGKKKCKKLKKHHSGLISSQNKTRQADSDTKKKKKKLSFLSIPNRSGIKNSQKLAKKCKNFKNTSLSLHFKPKWYGTGWEWYKKNVIIPIHSNSTRNKEFQKNIKKSQKILKNHYGHFSRQNVMGQAENEIKKIIVPIHSNLTRNSEFQKNCKKYQKKKKKNITMASFQAKMRQDRLRMREKKLIVPIHSNPT